MMHLAILICVCISAASAVKHYGMIPSEAAHDMVEEHAKNLLDNDLKLVSVFTTDSHHAHDGIDFLSSEMGIFNKTIFDIFTSSTLGSRENAIEARGPVKGKCEKRWSH